MQIKYSFKGKDSRTQEIARNLNINSKLVQLIFNRGIKTEQEVKKFLYADQDDLYDPAQIKNIDKVYTKIREAIDNKLRIWIFGDYDCDGVTATAIMVLGLKKLGANIDYRLPDRLSEGYGMSIKAVNELYEKGCDLIITVDNGIKQNQEIALAKNLGIQTIVLDHHEPGACLPDADILIDLHIEGESYPFKELAGCGLAWKVINYIYKREGREKESFDLIDIAAIGTVADVVSLTDENRIIVKEGLKRINNFNYARKGINALKKIFNIDPFHASAQDIGFKIAPAINAPGRLLEKGAELALKLFLNEDIAEETANELYQVNEDRKEITIESMTKAEEIIEKMLDDKVLVIFVPNVPEGVVGLVSGRLTEKYNKPSIVFSQGHSCFKASARSIPQFNLIKGLDSVSDIFIKYGGHAQAAGMSIEESHEKIEELRRRLNDYADKIISDEAMIKNIEIEYELEANEIDQDFLEILEALEPCGQNNPKPVFSFKNFMAKEKNVPVLGWSHYSFMGKNQEHVRIFGPDNIEVVGFSLSDYYSALKHPTCMNIVGMPNESWFNGRMKVAIELISLENAFIKTKDIERKASLLSKMQVAANKI